MARWSMPGLSPRRAELAKRGLAVLACALLTACATNALDTAPADPSQPWTPTAQSATPADASPAQPAAAAGAETTPQARTETAPVRDFSVPSEPVVGVLKPTPDISRDKPYGLADLIDIAQNQNPATRIAWQQARQAALASGMVEATYLPLITANVIGGYQKYENPLPLAIGSVNQITSTTQGISPQVALQWLVFDFGQRGSVHEVAKHNATAANVLFNGLHQKIIYDVTRAYFIYGAARSRVGIAAQNLTNSGDILDAAEARMKNGLGNTVEVAQARQQVAQARFGLVQAQGAERDTYQGLLGAMGVSPVTELKVKPANGRALPASIGAPTEKMVEAALSRRPDVLASFSAMKASQAGIGAAQAEFLPKVYLGAIAAGGNSSLSASGLPNIGQMSSASGVMVGATMPLYDGGLRAAQLKNAESLAAATEATFQKVRDEAAREIVVTAHTLRSALASYTAATALAQAAAVTYDAALSAYRAGVGNISVATAADSGLLTARLAQSDAHAAALVSAANLAFVLGAMTSRDVPASLIAR
ncbi:TolC family protein [Xanthobacter autotrophicus]|uniref:TolC family protein n=1 Tax=Xanthobacter autotrophicus TaxID=280 RepID=UPI00372627F3